MVQGNRNGEEVTSRSARFSNMEGGNQNGGEVTS